MNFNKMIKISLTSCFSSIYILCCLLLTTTTSCDKVKNPYPPQFVDIDTTLLSGVTLEQYKNTLWKDFTEKEFNSE